ncbi:hypothetical protein [Halovenus sp. HT40]|uniref:hypothetical protein n=1 Tax=Halovenus sp. HT40 TaxID=3126691 RepID=UPI00300ED423
MFDADRRRWVSAGLTAVGTAVGFTVLSVLTGGFVVVPLLGPVDVAVGLAVPLGLWFGGPAAVGIGTGVALSAVVESTLSWWTLLDATVYGAVGVLTRRLWGTLPKVASSQPPGIRSPAQWLEFVAVTVIVTTIAASAFAWGAVVGWASPFHAVALPEWTLLLRSTLVIGPPVLLAGSAVDQTIVFEDDQRLSIRSGAFWGGIVVPILWFTLGIASSIGLGSRRLEMIGGALALSVIAVTYLPRYERESDNNPSQQPTPTDA